MAEYKKVGSEAKGIEATEIARFGAQRRSRAGDRLSVWVAAEDKNLPFKGERRRVIGIFSNLDDMAVPIGSSRIGGIHGRIRPSAAVSVIGHHAMDVTVDGVRLYIFRTIHLGGADAIGGKPCLDQYVRLRVEVRRDESALPKDDREPLAGTVITKFRCIQGYRHREGQNSPRGCWDHICRY